MAESNFNPNAVSPAGAQGIAQFMPATAAAYGLRDPFDPVAAIDAQARLMGELLGQFGSVELALAAYNAGPGGGRGVRLRASPTRRPRPTWRGSSGCSTGPASCSEDRRRSRSG